MGHRGRLRSNNGNDPSKRHAKQGKAGLQLSSHGKP